MCVLAQIFTITVSHSNSISSLCSENGYRKTKYVVQIVSLN